ncbi:MAG: hypothetical protein MJH11_12160, partial [Lentisphaeria bacterium]|nr:hypothetical protein [Lentisphaeria bacterium]
MRTSYYRFHILKILSITDQSPIAGEAKATDFIELALNPYEERSKDPRALYQFEHMDSCNYTMKFNNDLYVMFCDEQKPFIYKYAS